jgi:hypothetical protein
MAMDFENLLGIGLLMATVVLAAATVGLWISTSKMAAFAHESVRLTRESIRVAEAASAPRLVLRNGGRSTLGETHIEGQIRVDNVGGGLAQDVEVATSWGPAPLGTPVLRPDKHGVASVQITSREWEQRRGTDDENPIPERVRFLDSGGHSHDVEAQSAGGATWIATIVTGR